MAARWLDHKLDELVAEVATLGMIIDPAARPSLAEALQERISATARQLRISQTAARRLVDHDTLRGMAQAVVTQFAVERPGLDIAAAPADTVVSRELASLALAALAEALRVHLANTDDPASAVQTARQCADLFAVHGDVPVRGPQRRAGSHHIGVVAPRCPAYRECRRPARRRRHPGRQLGCIAGRPCRSLPE